MARIPLDYNLRSLFVRRSSTLLTIVGIGATVAVLAGVLSLQRGFAKLFESGGRTEVAVFLRPGATNEGDSLFRRGQADYLIKGLSEIACDASGRPLASSEYYLALRLRKLDGGETNVPIRGVQPMSFEVHRDVFQLLAGRLPQAGSDEVVVGQSLTTRIQGAGLGQVLILNTTPFRVVGVFTSSGPFASEVWGDSERIADALERPFLNRVVARLVPGTDVAALADRLEDDKVAPVKVLTERQYLTGQTQVLSGVLLALGSFLALVMGTAAVFTGTNTMLAAISARSHEIGILLAIGFRPWPVFFSFMLEAAVLGLLGGLFGVALVLPLDGIKTGTTNFQTFTEVAFAFQVTPDVLGTAIFFALLLGLLGGAWPAWRASRMRPVEALRLS
jgi:putative ABC transport system permease protein